MAWYNAREMKILLNGQAEAVADGVTVADLTRQQLPQVQRETTENVR